MSTKKNAADSIYSAAVPLSSNCVSWALGVSTVDDTVTLTTAGTYKVWLASGNAAVTCALKMGGAAALPTDGGGAVTSTMMFRGDEIERVDVVSGALALHAILSSGAAADTLYLVLLP
jgi:hypothetical protein